MTIRNVPLAVALFFSASSVLAAAPGGTVYEQAQLNEEIQSCIAEVATHANYDNASQVRHEIVVTERRSIGHKLDIQTSVFSDAGDEAIRSYASRCIVYRDNKPVRFRIKEVDGEA